MSQGNPVIVVGAGIAGLCTAIHLKNHGYQVRVIEAQEKPGGRVQTDQHHGFLLDHGFQVLLTAYPEPQAMLDYKALDLRYFDPGALILHNGSTNTLGDPLRKPSSLLPSLFSGAANLGDFIRILRLRNRVSASSPEQLLDQDHIRTREAWLRMGFSQKIQQRFLGPFYRGIFLENDLETSSAMFEFTFKMFSEGHAAIPAKGMGEIPLQLAQKLGLENIRFNTKVKHASKDEVILSDGTSLPAEAVILAVDPWSSILEKPSRQDAQTAGATTCLYFSASKAPYTQKLIALKSAPKGLINNIVVINNISAEYAPEGKYLVSVSHVGVQDIEEKALIELIRHELSPWYGAEVLDWEYLASYHIPKALPDQKTVRSKAPKETFRLSNGVFVAGDYLLSGSIQGAMVSGRLAAAAVHGNLSASK